MHNSPQLWRHGVHSLPLHHSESSQPELRPMWCIDRSPKRMQHPPRLDHPLVLLTGTQKPEHNIRHRRPVRRALSLNMQTPASISPVLPGEEIPLDLSCNWVRNRRLRHIPPNYEPRYEEHRSAIFARPIARRQLQLGEERQGVLDRGDWGLRWWEVRQIL